MPIYLNIDLNESEIHVLQLAINTCRAEWEDYERARKFDNQTLELDKRVLSLKSLSRRFEVIAQRFEDLASI